MSAWPPRYEDNFVIRETGKPAYFRTIQAELQKRGKIFLGLSRREQLELEEALYMIDWTASLAACELRNSPWTAPELFKMESPKGTDPRKGVKAKQKYEQWLRYREHQYCLRFCKRARRALLIGEWGKAIHAALYAGNHLNGALAHAARKLRPGLQRGSRSYQLRAERNREIIFREAKDFCADGKKYNIKSVAMNIAKKHEGETGFPKYESIRRTLGQDRRWESRA